MSGVMVTPQPRGLSTKLADGRTFRAFPSTDGSAVCYVLEAADHSITNIALSDEALSVMVMLSSELRALPPEPPKEQQ